MPYRIVVKAFLLGMLSLAHLVPAAAQNRLRDSEATQLNAVASVPTGIMSVESLLHTLSKDSSLEIEAVDYLRGRTVVVCVRGCTVREILDDLAEMNEWTWKRTSPKHYLVSRRTTRKPQRLDQIPSVLQAALPLDWRVYLGIVGEGARAYRDFAGPGGNGARKLGPGQSFEHNTISLAGRSLDLLMESLKTEIMTGDLIPFSKLTKSQQNQLILILLYPVLNDMHGGLIRGRFHPFMADPLEATIELRKGRDLMVGSQSYEGSVHRFGGFGMPVPVRQ